MRALLLPISLIFISLFAKEKVCLFTPPKDWKAHHPKDYAPFIQVAFSGPEADWFRPTINLAIEKGVGTEEEFIECVNKLQKKKKDSCWKKRSMVETKAGFAHLFEDEITTNAGQLKILQAILVEEGTAYLLTANCLVKDLLTFLPLYNKVFKSMTLTEDLFSLLDESSKASLNQIQKNLTKQNFFSYQKKLENASKELGQYWQILALKEAYRNLPIKK